MKIVFVRHSLLSRGGDKMVAAHASHLASCGHDVTIKTNLAKTVFEIDPRVRLEPLRFRGKVGTLVAATVEMYDADRVVADIIPLACLLAIRNRRITVYFAQDYDESYYSSFLARFFIRLLYCWGLCFRRIPVIAVSEQLAALLKRRFKANVTTACNGVDSGIFFPDPSAELISEKENRKAILVLSRSDNRKGFDLAQEVILKLKAASAIPFEIWSVGERAEGKFSGLRHRDFGYVDEPSLRRIMSSADVFLYPSRHEGLPLMPLEAFACRCPVVTTTAVTYATPLMNAMVSELEDVDSLLSQVSRVLMDERLKETLLHNAYDYASEHSLVHCRLEFSERLLHVQS
jgi:glycosyltransferase involved in cell wall biosynthesis